MKNQKTRLAGILFVGGALLCGVIGLITSLRAGNRVENLEPATVAMLDATQPGKEVLIEGRISSRNPVQWDGSVEDRPQLKGFVAYVRETREVTEDEETGSWSVSEQVTPPLLLELADGQVRIENDDYNLMDGRTVEERDDIGDPSHTRYKGLERGDTIIAVGVLVSHVESPQIQADFVARGTRESYIARRRTGGKIFCAFSIIIAGVGGILLTKDRALKMLRMRS